MNWQWTYIERTLNMQWTRHRTLRKLRERANPWKSKEKSIFVLFSENHHQLHLFAAICSFLDCVQCVFNVAFTVCSLYVQCQLQWQAPWDIILQETMHLCNPVRPNLSHALQTHNILWHCGLTWPIPFILIPYLRRCVKHGRVQWLGVLDVNMACGPKKKKLFRDGWWTKSCTSTKRYNLDRLVHPLYPQVQCWVSFVIEVVQDFGHSTSFLLTTKHNPNVKEGVRGLVFGCK